YQMIFVVKDSHFHHFAVKVNSHLVISIVLGIKPWFFPRGRYIIFLFILIILYHSCLCLFMVSLWSLRGLSVVSRSLIKPVVKHLYSGLFSVTFLLDHPLFLQKFQKGSELLF